MEESTLVAKTASQSMLIQGLAVTLLTLHSAMWDLAMTECIRCKNNEEHQWVGECITDELWLRTQRIHEFEHCAYYLCQELGDMCPNCGKGEDDAGMV